MFFLSFFGLIDAAVLVEADVDDEDDGAVDGAVLPVDDEDEFFCPIFSSHTTGFLLKIGQSGIQIYKRSHTYTSKS